MEEGAGRALGSQFEEPIHPGGSLAPFLTDFLSKIK